MTGTHSKFFFPLMHFNRMNGVQINHSVIHVKHGRFDQFTVFNCVTLNRVKSHRFVYLIYFPAALKPLVHVLCSL